MSLATYQKKRHFDETPEPRGKPQRSPGALRFVVQKHQASHLHYDFRLEMEGVLKSWAVPKGPSLNPADKRLAMQVEDHPLDYRIFEGTIPEGNYGAGTVMVWDEGTYEPIEPMDRARAEKELLAELEQGRLKFTLHGKKLRGQFALVRMQRGKGNQWLLIKHRDAFATEEDVTQEDRSALSGRGMEEIASGNGKLWKSNRAGKSSVTASRERKRAELSDRSHTRVPIALPKRRAPKRRGHSPMPHQVKPMLATLVEEPFDRKDWFFEVKWDGYRAIAEIEKGKVQLYSRNFKSFEEKFAPIAEALRDFGHDAVLDGEIVVLDKEGKSHFQLLQNYQRTGTGTLAYYVFDLLYLDGEDLREAPLRRRKEILAPLLKKHAGIRYSDHIDEAGIAFAEAAAKKGLEGIIAKDAESPYRPGLRSLSWLKIKTRKQQEAVIGGFTEPRRSRQHLGALVLGVYEGEDLVYVGHAGGGFDVKGLADMRARLDPLIQEKCPFAVKPKTNAPVHWVKPVLVCEVAFQEWTNDGTMRMPIFLGLREDKPARAVKRELPAPVEETLDKEEKQQTKAARPEASNGRNGSARHARSLKTRGAPPKKDETPQNEPELSNLDKVYWPDEGYTKGDMIEYYRDVAPLILPYLQDRPLSLLRHPNGIRGQSFFQKDVSRQPPPDWVQTAEIPASESKKRDVIKYIVCQNVETLLYVANLGCIEMNPWNSRLESLDKPDYMIIDLDPQETPFSQVVETAQAVHKLLEHRCAECFCKTSGKRGLHIFVPLGAHYEYEQVRQFAEIIARLVNEQLPDTTSVVRGPEKRQHRVYLDFLQNSRGQTLAAAYSLRPAPGATVSTPLRWSEVTKKLDPRKFNIQTVRRRLDRVGDLWQPVLGKGADLAKCLENVVSK